MDADFADVGTPKGRTSLARFYILSALLAPFTVLTYLAASSGPAGDVRDRPVVLTTLATITGPFVGAIARNGQSCCLDCSLRLAAVLGPAPALGLIAQIAPLPFGRGREAARLVLWTLGWSVWLCGGAVSLLHAFS